MVCFLAASVYIPKCPWARLNHELLELKSIIRASLVIIHLILFNLVAFF